MKTILQQAFLALCIFTFVSCADKVQVYHPPRLDLHQVKPIGIITFSDNAVPSVSSYATDQFRNYIHNAQIGIPVVDLGTLDEVLQDLNIDNLDYKAYKLIGEKYNVAAVFSGKLTYSDIETDFKLKDLATLNTSIERKLHASLTASLHETQAGASIWSKTVSWNRKISNINFNANGNIKIKNNDQDNAYKKLVPDMMYDVTRDFRGWYTKEKAKK